ncbi:carbon monoxide dehydrogenase [Agaricicola taiwanensis]|uniref:Carbon monoxide dehydrogenase n=1 Tax=Agaricicola taiwanensis TaxID=591372 RepID=A0A8J2VJY4_9RHOB|nr:xanthine dehydrogenase family protein subunit M [Agaricicola taiwanensis]GGE33063.1 carbon monoxide dehydrogenase [Agaricicola taiwanensis]
MDNVTYHRAKTLAEAERLLAAHPDAKLLAGGQTLLPIMKDRRLSPANVIDIARIPELKGMRDEGDALVIGANTLHADVLTDPVVRGRIPALTDLVAVLGDPHVRHLGTLGGAVATNDPAGDYTAALVALDATISTNRRDVEAEAFFVGPFQTVLGEGEIVTSVRFPVPRRAGYEKFRHPTSRYALAGVFVAELAGGTVRVAVTGAGPRVFRLPAMEAALKANFSPDAVKQAEVPASCLGSDIHADRDYRAHLIHVMAEKAIVKALAM